MLNIHRVFRFVCTFRSISGSLFVEIVLVIIIMVIGDRKMINITDSGQRRERGIKDSFDQME